MKKPKAIHHNALHDFKEKFNQGMIYPRDVEGKDIIYRRFELYDEDDDDKNVVQTAVGAVFLLHEIGDITKRVLLNRDMINNLPIKVSNLMTYIDKKNDKEVYLPGSWSCLKIIPSREMSLYDTIQPFLTPHSEPEDYELYVVMAFAAYILRCPMWFSTTHAYGKSSIYETMDYLFGECPVIEHPKTVPAFYKYIPKDGTIVLDEMSKKDQEAADKIAYALNIMGNHSKKIIKMDTGGSASYGTQTPRDITNCSTICLMNRRSDYRQQEKFAEYMFMNNGQIDSRFMKFRPGDGKLDGSFFSMWQPFTKDEEKWLIMAMKTIAYYKKHYNHTKKGWYCGITAEFDAPMVERFINEHTKDLVDKTRHIHTLRNIVSVISVYCATGNHIYNIPKFQAMTGRLMHWLKSYQKMVKEDIDAVEPFDETTWINKKDTETILQHFEDDVI